MCDAFQGMETSSLQLSNISSSEAAMLQYDINGLEGLRRRGFLEGNIIVKFLLSLHN